MGKKIPPKITIALNAKNEWVFIDDVPQNGNQCDCFCPYCHAPLQAKKEGNKRQHHFAHMPDSECNVSHESTLHLLAKEIIEEKKAVTVPAYYPKRYTDCHEQTLENSKDYLYWEYYYDDFEDLRTDMERDNFDPYWRLRFFDSQQLRFKHVEIEKTDESNSLYHRDYAQHEPVEITIEPEGISILNCPGPDRSIPMSAIEKGDILKSRRYRNRRLGDFLKELDLTEGRSTGVPTIQEKLADNGSPRATFETTEDRLTFLIHIPIHAGCGNKPATEKTTVITTEKSAIGSEKIGSGSEKSSEKNQAIISAIKLNPKVTAAEIAMKLGVSSRAVEKRIKTLRENGVIRRIGGDKGGYWEVIENGTEQ